MRTIYRLTIMSMSLLVASGAILAYGPPDVVQPIASRIIGFLDELGGVDPAYSSTATGNLVTGFDRSPANFTDRSGAEPMGATMRPDVLATPKLRTDEKALPRLAESIINRPIVAPELLLGETPPPDSARPATRVWQALKSCGAVDQHLESWGAGGELYRFRCNVPWIDSPLAMRHFEAIGATPEEVLTTVVREIQGWQASGARRPVVAAAL